jgi:hypothetical protein
VLFPDLVRSTELRSRLGEDGGRAHDLLRQALAAARELGLLNIERGAVELLSPQ